MNAKIKPGYTTKRQHLADVLPLEAPFTLCISPTQACNFKCFYCTHSKSEDELRKMNFHSINMDFRLFQKILNDSKRFDACCPQGLPDDFSFGNAYDMSVYDI